MNRAPVPAASLRTEHKGKPSVRPAFSSGRAAPQQLIETRDCGVKIIGWDPNRGNRDLDPVTTVLAKLGLGQLN